MLATIIWSLMSLATPMALISFGIYGCKAKKKAPNPPPSPGVPPPSPAQPPPPAKAYKIEHSTRLSIHVPYEESEMKMPTEGDAKHTKKARETKEKGGSKKSKKQKSASDKKRKSKKANENQDKERTKEKTDRTEDVTKQSPGAAPDPPQQSPTAATTQTKEDKNEQLAEQKTQASEGGGTTQDVDQTQMLSSKDVKGKESKK